MELFSRRYMSLFACLFLIFSAVATLLDGVQKLIALAVLAGAMLLAAIGIFIFKKHRFYPAAVLIALIFIAVAFFNSLVFISIPQSKATAYAGDTHSAQVRILSCEHSDGESSEYTVRIEHIGDESPNIKAYLYCDVDAKLDYGDKMIGVFYTDTPSSYDGNDKDILLTLSIDSGYPIYYKNVSDANRFSIDGIRDICRQIQQTFKDYVDWVFGEDIGALVKAFLINDTSDISGAVKLDFRRSGITHLLAVSGLHITLLMGGLEFILRKLFIPKGGRCLVISLAALLLLILADFSASAVRSVFMLYGVYLSYCMAEDHDTVTSLFVSVFLIALISPFSVYDLGMWMSFLATLGLVTVYAYIEKKLPHIKKGKSWLGILGRVGLGAVKAVMITLVANFFLLGIMWQFFGEISLAAIPANLILSPIVTVYMPLCVIGLLLGWIPYIGTATAWLTGTIGNVILWIADLFANARGAVVSLRYPFAKILVLVFCAALALMLVIRLKRKLLIIIPAAGFTVCFCICLIISSLNAHSTFRYAGYGDNELLYVDCGSHSTVCDVTYGGYAAQRLLLKSRAEYATEIENYVITHCHKGHPQMIRSLLSRIYVRKLYIPLSAVPEELCYADELRSIAAEYGSQVIFYESGSPIGVDDGFTLYPNFILDAANDHTRVFVCLSNGEDILTYTDASQYTTALRIGAVSDTLIIGDHGGFDVNGGEYVSAETDTRVIFASKERSERTRIACSKEQGSFIKGKGIKILMMPLG